MVIREDHHVFSNYFKLRAKYSIDSNEEETEGEEGGQTTKAYSTIGRTRVVYSWRRVEGEE